MLDKILLGLIRIFAAVFFIVLAFAGLALAFVTSYAFPWLAIIILAVFLMW